MPDQQPTLVFFGHHKCATTWVNAISVAVTQALGLRYSNVHNAAMFDRDLAGFLHRHPTDFLSYSNANWTYAAALRDFRGFHVIRDPRDIVVSAYFSHLHSHPTDDWSELVEHRNRLKGLSLEEGLLAEMDFREDEIRTIAAWDYERDEILEIKMEAIIACPYEPMVKAFAHLGLVDDRAGQGDPTGEQARPTAAPARLQRARAAARRLLRPRPDPALAPRHLPVSTLLELVYQNRFSKIAEGRSQGEEDVTSHYRKGIAGDWANYFTAEHRRVFKERYGDALLRLGYEKDLDW